MFAQAETFPIVSTAGPGGAITPSGTVTSASGANETFLVTPGTWSTTRAITVDGVDLPPASSHTFTDVEAPHTIHAQFLDLHATLGIRFVPVTVTRGSETAADTFGTAPGAGYGLDASLGERELDPRPFSPAFDARFIDHRESPSLGQGQRVHLQAEALDTFRLAFQGGAGSYRYVIRWSAGLGAEWRSLRLVDAAGTGLVDVDMLATDSAVVTQSFIKAVDIIGHPMTPAVMHTITATSDPGGTISPAGDVAVEAGGSQEFVGRANEGFVLDGFLVDGSAVTGSTRYTFTNVGGPHSIHALFVDAPSTPVTFRTFTAADLSEKFPVQKRPNEYRFSFTIVNETPDVATGLIVRFGGTSKNVMTLDQTSPLPVAAALRSRVWELTGGTVAPGETVTVSGVLSGEPVRILGWQWEYPRFIPYSGRTVTNIVPPGQVPLYPMPNGANVREELFHGSFDRDPLLVGTPRPDSAASYGWVKITEPYRLRSSLEYHRRSHTGTPRRYSFTRERRLLTPVNQDNALFANQAVLKFNLRASMLGVTPVGLGELMFEDTVAHPMNGKSLHDIAAIVDSLLTGCIPGSVAGCVGPELYVQLNQLLERINGSFAGPMDTLSFAGKLVLKGVASPSPASGLHMVASVKPRTMAWQPYDPSAQVPSAFALRQNYPNPFNPSTTIQFDLPRDGRVSLAVYDQLGRLVATLLENEDLPGGTQEAVFDGSALGSGVYYYRLTAALAGEQASAARSVVGKMLLVK
jgi:hypothetical protein